jgi:hypothetical protein
MSPGTPVVSGAGAVVGPISLFDARLSTLFTLRGDRATLHAMKKILLAALLLTVFATPVFAAAAHHHHHHHHHHHA